MLGIKKPSCLQRLLKDKVTPTYLLQVSSILMYKNTLGWRPFLKREPLAVFSLPKFISMQYHGLQKNVLHNQ